MDRTYGRPVRVVGTCVAKTISSDSKKLEVAALGRGAAPQCPAMPNGRCRIHGGLSTGSKTSEGRERSRMGPFQHGRYSKAVRVFPRLIRWRIETMEISVPQVRTEQRIWGTQPSEQVLKRTRAGQIPIRKDRRGIAAGNKSWSNGSLAPEIISRVTYEDVRHDFNGRTHRGGVSGTGR